jgi:hypothetical protein
MNIKLTVFILIVTYLNGSAQPTFNKQTIANAGEKSIFAGGSFTWTLGEMSVGTVSVSNLVLIQGFAPTMQSSQPTPPIINILDQPTCTVATGSIELTGLPTTGTWTITRYPGGNISTGSGSSTIVTGLSSGTYYYTVTDALLETSGSSSYFVINVQPSTPTAPVIASITQPSCMATTGTVTLNSLPSPGTWTLTRSPGNITSTGTGLTTSVSGLVPGDYTFTVTNSQGCISSTSNNFTLITAKLGVIPKIKKKFNGGLIICINLGDSLKRYQWYLDESKLIFDTLQYVVTKGRPGSYKVYATDLNGCKNFSELLSSTNNKSLELYPNPASVSFSIVFDQEVQSKTVVSIFNSAGYKVLEIHAETNNDQSIKEIPVANLDEGIYIVKVVLEDAEEYYTKLIVAK